MTLSRQLILSGFALLLCLFIGMLVFVVRNTETFLNQQMASHSQDTATALGLTLTLTMKQNDAVMASRIVDAIWDRGYFSNIEVLTASDQPVVLREAPVRVENVPQWFIHSLTLNTPPQEALIMDNWRRVGTVRVTSNPGFAYEQIWSIFTESLKWLGITLAMALGVGAALLYIILKPLRAITSQAIAICNQEFPIQKSLPWTLDLRVVVEAMNIMSARLKSIFEKQALESETLRMHAYQDPVTELPNQRYFDLQMDFLLHDKDKSTDGSLLLLELYNFKVYNQRYGHMEGDKLLCSVRDAIVQQCQNIPSAVIAHGKGSDFFIILPTVSKEGGETLAENISVQLAQFRQNNLSPESNIAHIGVVTFKANEEKSSVVSRADMALRAAQMEGENRWISMMLKSEEVHTASEWKSTFDDVIQKKSIILHYQKIELFAPKKLASMICYEVFMRVKSPQNIILSAGKFIPMAEELGMMGQLDKIMIEQVLTKVQSSSPKQLFFINLSPSIIRDIELQNWILSQIETLSDKASQVIFELSEPTVTNHLEQVREFYLRLSQAGVRTSIDHYGRSFHSFSYLSNLKLNFLKIDGSFTRQIEHHHENRFLIRSMVNIAHSLGIAIIAESVENEQEYQALAKLKVDGVQGYFVGSPTSIDV